MKLKLKILPNAMVVPSAAVQEGANGSYVYSVTPENTVKVAYVTVVQEGETQTVIGSGIGPGDLIVTRGFAALQDGAKVKPETPEEAAPAAAANQPPGTAPAEATHSGEPRRRRQDASGGEGSSADGERRHRQKKQSQGEEQAGVAETAPAAQGSAKP
jgi:multidrug efflux system membrane fusion protein